jgi:uncharacterized protein YciI
MRSRWLFATTLSLFVVAVLIDVLCSVVNRWLDQHSLTTNLISSAFFALAVSFAIRRFAWQQEAERNKIPAREALERLLFAAEAATASLRNLIETRAAVVSGPMPSSTEVDSPLDALQTPRSREIAEKIRRITLAEPEWLATELAPHAERLADLASERVVAAGPLLAFASNPRAAQWALEDASTLRSIAKAAENVASNFQPPEKQEMSPLMAAIGKAARESLPTLPDDVAAAVRAGIAAEEEYDVHFAERVEDQKRIAAQGVRSLAMLIALRENAPQFVRASLSA